jgi:DNA-binding HxlR family transcriptional regulator
VVVATPKRATPKRVTPKRVTNAAYELADLATAPPVPRACPMAASLQLLGERWTLLAIRELTYGVHRFDQIARFTGASRDILADRLRGLEEAGVVERRQYSEHPPRFEYHLTDAGQELRPVLLSLAEWGSRWAQEPPTATFAHDCGHALEIDQVCHHCGEPVTSSSTRVRNRVSTG